MSTGMTLPLPYGQTITVSRPGGQDRFGDPLPGSSHDVGGCVVYQDSSTEQTYLRNTVVTTYRVLAPSGTDIRTTDRVYLPNDDRDQAPRWYVEGDPAPWRDPFTGWEPGIDCRLRRVTG